MEYDFLIISGGVSAGKYDLVKPALRELSAEFVFERVRVQPGQPTAFGIANGKPLFGLPGNPGSSLITYQLFARPALELLAGLAEPVQPLLSVPFEAPFKHKLGLTRFPPRSPQCRRPISPSHLLAGVQRHPRACQSKLFPGCRSRSGILGHWRFHSRDVETMRSQRSLTTTPPEM